MARGRCYRRACASQSILTNKQTTEIGVDQTFAKVFSKVAGSRRKEKFLRNLRSCLGSSPGAGPGLNVLRPRSIIFSSVVTPPLRVSHAWESTRAHRRALAALCRAFAALWGALIGVVLPAQRRSVLVLRPRGAPRCAARERPATVVAPDAPDVFMAARVRGVVESCLEFLGHLGLRRWNHLNCSLLTFHKSK